MNYLIKSIVSRIILIVQKSELIHQRNLKVKKIMILHLQLVGYNFGRQNSEFGMFPRLRNSVTPIPPDFLTLMFREYEFFVPSKLCKRALPPSCY